MPLTFRHRHAIFLPVALALLSSALGVLAQGTALETQVFRYGLNTNATSRNLTELRTGREWLAPLLRSFASVKKGGKFFAATRLNTAGELTRVDFGAAAVQADFRLTSRPRYLVIELVHVLGAGVELVRFADLQVACKDKAGNWLGVCWDNQFAVCLLGLSDGVNVQLLGSGRLAASVYPEFGIEGQKVALVAAPTPNLLDVIEEVERDFKLPSPKIDGEWAKKSRAVRTSYLFTDLTEANADETIRYAKLGGFEYIMTYDSTWSKSFGSYPVNTNNFPRGEASLKATVDRLHAAGLKAGLHFLTSFVGKNDPLVRPRPDPRLLKDDQAELAADIDEKTVEIPAKASLASFPAEGAFYGDTKAGFDIQIDDELLQYRAIGGPGTNLFLRCVRGYLGTKPAAHNAGAKIHHLVERYGCYLADLRTSLKGDISERISGIINRCGFDMVYFDGGECNVANGPFWYWVSQQQADVCRRFNREVLVQGSGGTHWTWHWFARGACDDFAAVAPKQYLDFHKIADSWNYYTDSFLPPELGWWGFLAYEPHQPATTPDEVEYYAVRMLALGTPVSLETHLSALKRNGRTQEMLQLLGRYEQLRLKRAVPAAVRQKLRSGEWRLAQDGPKPAFAPIRYDGQRLITPQEASVTNIFGPQPLKFRLQALASLAAAGDRTNLTLLRSEPAARLALPGSNTPMPGALAGRVEFTKAPGQQVAVFTVSPNTQIGPGPAGKPLNLLRHRALAVKLRVTSPGAVNHAPAPVLNVQLEGLGKTYRDHYIDLDFTGEKLVSLPEPNTERMLPEFRPAHANYAFKAAMYGFNYRQIVAMNFRWMRLPRNSSLQCEISAVEAFAEADVPLLNPALAIGQERLAIPIELKTGDYAEYWGSGPVKIFDRNGVLLKSLELKADTPLLHPGESKLLLKSETPAAARFVLITTGEPIGW